VWMVLLNEWPWLGVLSLLGSPLAEFFFFSYRVQILEGALVSLARFQFNKLLS